MKFNNAPFLKIVAHLACLQMAACGGTDAEADDPPPDGIGDVGGTADDVDGGETDGGADGADAADATFRAPDVPDVPPEPACEAAVTATLLPTGCVSEVSGVVVLGGGCAVELSLKAGPDGVLSAGGTFACADTGAHDVVGGEHLAVLGLAASPEACGEVSLSLCGTLVLAEGTEVPLEGVVLEGVMEAVQDPDPSPGTGCVQSPEECPHSPADEVCERYVSDRAQLQEGVWSGAVASCAAGTMDSEWQERALLSTNLYRWLAGLEPFTLDTSVHAAQQECALMMHANGALSHGPPPTWACYTQAGAQAAGSSNIATTPAVQAVDLYMADPGNATTLGHRRWILSSWIGSTAFGSTNGFSCMRTAGFGSGGPVFTAWPPPGFYPVDLNEVTWSNPDETGWSVQSNSVNLGQGTVNVTEDGVARPVTVSTLLPNYGSSSAISIIPNGWTTTEGRTYEVEITGLSQPISYAFEAIRCQ